MDDKKNILVIDDIDTNIKLIAAHLKNTPYNVIEKGSGVDGLSFLLKNYREIDLVFLDISMPDITGIEICKRFRQEVCKEDVFVPVVAYTAHAMQDEKELFLSQGFDDLLIKPVMRSRIFEVLKKWLPSSD